jgi:hypothetical protein
MKKIKVVTLVLALALMVSACNFPFSDNSDEVAASVAETVAAMEAKVEMPTLAPLPTPMPPEPTEDMRDSRDEKYCDDEKWDCDWDKDYWHNKDRKQKVACLSATAVDQNIKDGTNFSPNEAFTKKWTFTNTGYCDWNEDYKIIFKTGDQMDGPDSQELATEVNPGEVITIAVDMIAPADEGRYTGYWMLQTDDGDTNFAKVWVTIDVE